MGTLHFVMTLALLQHVEVPIPNPSKDELLLKVEAASLNPFDWKVQKGMLWPFLPSRFPNIPGNLVLLSWDTLLLRGSFSCLYVLTYATFFVLFDLLLEKSRMDVRYLLKHVDTLRLNALFSCSFGLINFLQWPFSVSWERCLHETIDIQHDERDRE